MSRYGKNAKSIAAYGRRSRTRSQSGAGYSTSRADSRYSFEVRINHEQFDTTIAAAKRSIESEVKRIENLFANMGKTNKVGSGTNFSLALNKRKGSSIGKLSATINSRLDGEKIVNAMFDTLATDIGNIGVNNMRSGIQNPENAPKSFRYDTGAMYNSVRYKKRRTATEIVIEIGWLDKFYKYFDFQERGTSKVGAMNSITRAYRTTAPQSFRLMSKFLKNYTNKGGFSGRYTR